MAVITGNNAGNTLTGTAGADAISGRGGDDRLSGLGGDDRLLGETGNDILDGGAGDDLLDGGTGVDIASYADLASGIVAENGDHASGGGDGDWGVASAAGGADQLLSVEGVVGTRFADQIRGADGGAELIRGGSGNDILEGGYYSGASDTVYGGGGNDVILGGEEIVSYRGSLAGFGDSFFGGDGNDLLAGLDGGDTLRGEGGADHLSGGPDRDVLFGGAGGDTFAYLNDDRGIGSGTTQGDFGADLIADFRRGADQILFEAVQLNREDGPETALRGFADLDSNRNGVLDAGDLWVDVERVAFGGAARTSTVIDVTAYNQDVPGEQSLTVFGVTGLTAADFASEALA